MFDEAPEPCPACGHPHAPEYARKLRDREDDRNALIAHYRDENLKHMELLERALEEVARQQARC